MKKKKGLFHNTPGASTKKKQNEALKFWGYWSMLARYGKLSGSDAVLLITEGTLARTFF